MVAACFLMATILFDRLLCDYSQAMHLANKDQGQLGSLSVEVIRPFWGWMLMFMALIAPLGPLIAIALEKSQGTLNFWITYRFSPNDYFLGKWLAWVALNTAVTLLLVVIPLSVWLLSAPDLGLVLSGWLTVWLVSLFILSLSFFINLCVPYPALALGLTYATLLLIAFLPWLCPITGLKPFLHELSFLTHSYSLMHGRLYLSDGLYFGASIMAFISLSRIRTRALFNQLQ